MGKRKASSNKLVGDKRKHLKEQQDNQLSTGIFGQDVVTSEDDLVNDWDNVEQDYELRPRNTKDNGTEIVEGLPIKRGDGKLERVVRKMNKIDTSEAEISVDKEEKSEALVEPEDADNHNRLNGMSPRQVLIETKTEIADLATKLIENPEENIPCLIRLRKMTESRNFVTCQLSIMALIPVFKSLAPSYRIRPLSDTEKRQKVSKDIAQLRNFEQSLVANYVAYVNRLAQLAVVSFLNSQNDRKVALDEIKLGLLATKAACELCLSSLRNFNYRSEVITIICRRLNRTPSNDDDFNVFLKCLRTLESLLIDDQHNGDVTFDVCKLLCKSIRDKKFRVDESVINIFLSLSLLNDYDPNNNKNDEQKPKLKKKDRLHLSKKERKARKERKEIEEEMRKAEDAISAEEREKYQADVLKMLLSLYLEILKASSPGTLSKNSYAGELMAPVLEGLARFGNMANIDLLGDFLEVLREIMTDIILEHTLHETNDEDSGGMFNGKEVRSILLCVSTAFALVMNHSSVGKLPITIDLSKFISYLYVVLADLSLDTDLEFSSKTLRLVDPLSTSISADKPHVNVSTKAELLLRCLDFIFFRSRNGTVPRASSFIKRLYILSLQTPEKTSLAILKFVGKLTSRYGESLKGLWNTEERISGEGSYFLGIEKSDREVELERCNSGAATLWENVLLDKHYSQMVKDGSRTLFKNSRPHTRQ
ncbi:uncharacterized protein PRCAT00003990001 [Priceomyces carsonii]|uniref:uncharacterized protein n=1 Tax=Priceomyces carsonii TaxID=28549 RepID=UPI002ED7D016|nr:unnamed protein product [Priceomyces carsonii]